MLDCATALTVMNFTPKLIRASYKFKFFEIDTNWDPASAIIEFGSQNFRDKTFIPVIICSLVPSSMVMRETRPVAKSTVFKMYIGYLPLREPLL